MRMKREIAAGALLMGTLAAILFIGNGAESEARTVYAQGEYVASLAGTASPFADVANVVMPCVVGVSNRANTYSIISGQTEVVEQATGAGGVVATGGRGGAVCCCCAQCPHPLGAEQGRDAACCHPVGRASPG